MNTKIILSFLVIIFIITSCRQSIEQLFDEGLDLIKQKKYDKAIGVYNKIISRNNKLQLAYYNRGLAYTEIKDYKKALADFNEVMALQTKGSVIFTINQNTSFADEETKSQVPYYDALYQSAQTKFHLDSFRSSYSDFQSLIANNYQEKSNCTLWQGTIWLKAGKPDTACQYFLKAQQIALSDDDRNEADKMISTYCNLAGNNR